MSVCSESNTINPSSQSSASASLASVSDIANIWLLPDGVTDLLSDEAQKQEMLRYKLTQLLVRHGYELICPPMIEYTESLLNNASEDLKRQTFKIIDQLTGRLMGVRADITPQILRIDAHLNQQRSQQHIARYCYAGHVIHTLPTGLFGSRTPLQLGAEIFGSDNIAADIELLDVLFTMLSRIKLEATLHIDIGQVGIFKRLCELAQLGENESQQLMALYANKALPELKRLCQDLPFGSDFYAIGELGHNMASLKQALSQAACEDAVINEAMQQIATVKAHLEQTWQCHVSIDITELSGYHYHTGLVFNVYLNNESQAVARGGRFDGMVIQAANGLNDSSNLDSINCADTNNSANNISANTSDKRPATGFSLDLTRLQSHINLPAQPLVVVDFDSYQRLTAEKRAHLHTKVKMLREEGYRVIQPLDSSDSPEFATHRLVLENEDWQLQSINS